MTKAIIWWGVGAIQTAGAIYVAPNSYIKILFALGAIASFVVAYHYYLEDGQ